MTWTSHTHEKKPELLAGRPLALAHIVITMVIILTIGLYIAGTVYWVDWLHNGLTGVWCRDCNYTSGSLTLIVAHGSPAARAGLQTGDVLLLDAPTVAAHTELTTTGQADSTPYGEALPSGHPGEAVTVTVRHQDGTEATVTFTRELGWNELLAGFTMLGLPARLTIAILIGLAALFGIGFAGVGVAHLWFFPGDRMAIVFSAAFVTIGLTSNIEPRVFAEYNLPAFWRMGLNAIDNFSPVAAVAALLLFPNAQLVPRWAKWPLIVYALWHVVLQNIIQLPIIAQTPGASMPHLAQTISSLLLYGGFLFGIGAQVYRYRYVATPEQRQQAKWIVFGTAVGVAAYFVNTTGNRLLFDPTRATLDDERILYWALSARLSILALLIAPLAAMIAVTRYRLWDVDFVINRSLMYGGLTALLGLFFVGGFYGLRVVLQSLLGSQQTGLAIGLAAALAAGTFNPVRNRMRRLIDRRIYGIHLDYKKAIRERALRRETIQRESDTKTHFGHYTGLELLGRGGMGEIYLGEHPTLHRRVAIKIMPAQQLLEAENRQRFLREAQITAQLKHPNIVQVFDVGEINNIPYMVMEYVEGQSLSHLVKERGKLPLAEVLPCLQDIASALDYAHQQGVIHRDIKPANVLIEPITTTGHGRASRAVLMDFGIAKIHAAAPQITREGMVGTLDYVAPEQIQGAAGVDKRADIYSFGVMTYQVLTGELPFKHSHPGAVLMAHLMQPPPDPRNIVGDLPRATAHAIMRAMAKKPAERYPTAGAMLEEMVEMVG